MNRDKEALLSRAQRGASEFIVWSGAPLELDVPGKNIAGSSHIKTGTPGVIVQVGNFTHENAISSDPNLEANKLLVVFRGGPIMDIEVDSAWVPLPIPSEEYVRNALSDSLTEMMKNDAELLQSGVNERTLTQRLALYLNKRLPDWDLDCEYNRVSYAGKHNKNFSKFLNILAASGQIIDFQATYPDIIAHKRLCPCNLLVIEAKKVDDDNDDYRRARDTDIKKLKKFHEQLGYKYKVFVSFRTGENFGIHEVHWLEMDGPPTLRPGDVSLAWTPHGVNYHGLTVGMQIFAEGGEEDAA